MLYTGSDVLNENIVNIKLHVQIQSITIPTRTIKHLLRIRPILMDIILDDTIP